MSDTITINRNELDEIVEKKVKQQLTEKQRQLSRRSVLGAMAGVAGAGALGFGVGSATADPSEATGTVYFEQIGSETYPVQAFFVENEYNVDTTNDILNVNRLLTDELELNTREITPAPIEPTEPNAGDVWIDTSEVE